MATGRLVSTSVGTNREAFGAVEWLLTLSLAATWGVSFLFIAIGLDSFEPGVVTALRIGLGAVALWFFPKSRVPIEREAWPRLFFLSLVWISIPFTLFPVAQQWITSALAGMLNGAMPLFAATIAALLLRRIPGPSQIAGLLVGFVGIVLVAAPSWEGRSEIRGIVLVLAAVALYGLATNVAVPLQQQYGSLPVAYRVLVLSALTTLPFGIWSVQGSDFSWGSFVAVAFLGIAGTGLAIGGMTALVGRAGATRGSIVVYFIPIVAVAAGVIFRDEHVEALSLAGIALVLIGAFLASRRES